MAIGDDFSVSIGGDIRHVANANNYTVLELHRWLQDLADDAQASGDDLVDITTETPSDRSTDNIVTLNGVFNIDDTAARFFYDGSVTQNAGDEVYSGLEILGVVNAGTEVMIVQDNKVLPAWWGTGVNANAPASLIQSNLVKTRTGGADIDGKRILVLARELGDQFKEFPVTMGLANSVAAISTAADLNNETVDATIAGWTTIANTEGFQLISIETVDEEYYAQLDKGSQSLNDTYEYTKFVSQRSHVTLAGTDTGTNYIVDDNDTTSLGQAQSFTSKTIVGGEKLTEARFDLKVGLGTPTGVLVAELYASAGGVIPTGSALATSEDVLASLLSASYQEVIFRFNDNVTLASATQYCIVIRHVTGTATDYVHVDGAASGSVAGENAAVESPASTWTAAASADLKFTVKSSPIWHDIAGEQFRGITHEIVYDNELTGPFTENEVVFWGTEITYDAPGGSFVVGEYVEFQPTGGGAKKNGGKVLADSGTVLSVALEDIAPTSALVDGDLIAGITSAASGTINTTITDADKAGGEGILLALDDNGADGDLYIQLITGLAPVDNLKIVGRTSGATCLVFTTVTGRTISPEFIGATTGTNLIGAYGIGFDVNDIGSSDKFFDLTNTLRTPPNNVTFTVTGVVAGEDRVLVAPRTGSVINKSQLATDVTLSGATETLIQMSAAVPNETPLAGTLRVTLDSAIEKRIRYESFAVNDYTILADDTFVDGDVDISDGAGGNSVNIASHNFRTLDKVQLSNSGGTLPGGLATVTDYWIIRFDAANIQFAASVADAIAGTEVDITSAAGGGTHTIEVQDFEDFSSDNATAAKDSYITYIDTLARATSEAFTAVYIGDRDLFVRVRDGGATPIKTFEGTAAVFSSANSSVAAVRTSDA